MISSCISRSLRLTFVAIVSTTIACSNRCHAQVFNNLRDLSEIASAAQSNAVADETLIRAIARRLDDLVGKLDNSSINEKAQLIRVAATIPITPDDADKEAATIRRRVTLERFVTAEFGPDLDGSVLLHLAAGITGSPLDQKKLMTFARGESVPSGLRLVALEAVFNQPQITKEILSDLTALSKDEWHFVDPVDIGPRDEKIIYPIRDMAVKIVQKLDATFNQSTTNSNASQQSAAEQPKRPSLVQTPATKKEPEANSAPTQTEAPTSSTPLSIIVVLIVAAIGLLWLLFKRLS